MKNNCSWDKLAQPSSYSFLCNFINEQIIKKRIVSNDLLS